MRHALVAVLLTASFVAPVSAQEPLSFGFGIGVSNSNADALSLSAMLKADVATPMEGVGVRAEVLLQQDAGTQEFGLLSLTVAPMTGPVRPYLIASPGVVLANGPEFAFGFGMGAEVPGGPVPLFVEFRGFLEPGIQDFAVAVVGLRFSSIAGVNRVRGQHAAQQPAPAFAP